MLSLKQLGDTITQQLENDKHLRDLSHILNSYNGEDWHKYIKFDETRYVKTIVYCNDYIDIFIICWNINQSSRIHDHPAAGCLMRILDGKLQEDLYIKDNNNCQFIKSSILRTNDITYKEKDHCVHNIINMDQRTVSLHIYSPSGYKTNYYQNNIAK